MKLMTSHTLTGLKYAADWADIPRLPRHLGHVELLREIQQRTECEILRLRSGDIVVEVTNAVVKVGGTTGGYGETVEDLRQRHVGHGDRLRSDAGLYGRHGLVEQQPTLLVVNTRDSSPCAW